MQGFPYIFLRNLCSSTNPIICQSICPLDMPAIRFLAVTMVQFPAPFSLCSITSFLGAVLTAFVQIITEGKVDPGSSTISLGSIISIMLVGGMVIATCVSFQTWAVKKKGPVLVSMFSPIQTVCSAILSAIVLGQAISWRCLYFEHRQCCYNEEHHTSIERADRKLIG